VECADFFRVVCVRDTSSGTLRRMESESIYCRCHSRSAPLDEWLHVRIRIHQLEKPFVEKSLFANRHFAIQNGCHLTNKDGSLMVCTQAHLSVVNRFVWCKVVNVSLECGRNPVIVPVF
jgi:hypothetical protein